MTSALPVLCDSCVHLNGDRTTCKAFPSGIPKGISMYGDDHREPIPNQGNTIVWGLKPGGDEAFADWVFVFDSAKG